MPELTDPDRLAEVADRVRDLDAAHRLLVEAADRDPDRSADQVAAARRAALAVVGALFRRPDGTASDYGMAPRELLAEAVSQLSEAARHAEPGQAERYLDLASQLAVYAPHPDPRT